MLHAHDIQRRGSGNIFVLLCGREIYLFRTDWVTLEYDATHGRNITLKIRIGSPALGSRRSILPYHCGFICFLLFPALHRTSLDRSALSTR